MTQQEKLNLADFRDVIWATVQIDELLQTLHQNTLLVERGYWTAYLFDCDENWAKYYFKCRELLISDGTINEKDLRKECIQRIHRKV